MSIVKIRQIPDPVLKKVSKKVKNITPTEIKIIENLTETLIHSNGLGLAAPQIGILKRIIVVYLEDKPIPIINPTINELSTEEITDSEGCLSYTNMEALVPRKKKVLLKGFDINGKEIEIEGEDIIARLFQHEIDHLNGILFIDRMIEGTLIERKPKPTTETQENN